MNFEALPFPLLTPDPGEIIAMQALKGSEHHSVSLIALNKKGDLWKLDLHSGQAIELLHVDIPDLNTGHPVQIIVSQDECFVGVSNIFGQHAALFDLHLLKKIMNLSRDDYHYQTCTFPLAFADYKGRTLLIHGTEWNRLDLLDVRSGKRITTRQTPVYDATNGRSEHYLDYFFGKLHVSQGGEWIVNTGWIWHPYGELRSWNLPAWVMNCWESEDGPSVQTHLDPQEDWDQPLVWINEHTIAVWGRREIGMLEEEEYTKDNLSFMLVFIDVHTGERLKVITQMPSYSTKSSMKEVYSHPQGKMAAVGEMIVLWDPESGLSVWNMDTGIMEAAKKTVCPDFFHSYSELFLEMDETGRFWGRRLV